ncbi:AAA family ATPase [Burkholderiaceae bacterium FT117]|uniref:AAA family ATPase n=1 Tax=Zeimonas sediminis TaxID=2944268 RepID=UPI0023430978|nr:AAA family ATPase [Zeimonas sediminis]MCM5570482.1 AAA family ATPase [Zeimonas sediminis]
MTSNLVGSGSGIAPIDPSLTLSPASAAPAFESRAEAALRWLGAGFSVIPIGRGELSTGGASAWLDQLSADAVDAYWREHPDHDFGVVLSDELVVFEVSSLDAQRALDAIEEAHGITPTMIDGGSTGIRHWFRCSPGSRPTSDWLSEQSRPPLHIGIAAAGVILSLPPSEGRGLLGAGPQTLADLAEVGQDLIAAIIEHNRRLASGVRPPVDVTPCPMIAPVQIVEATGVEPGNVWAAVEPPFAPVDDMALGEDGKQCAPDRPRPTALDKFSLRGRAGEVERNAVEQIPLLGRIAMVGQFTAIYAPPNGGKTLLTLHLLREATRLGRVDPARVYYINVDDHAQGLLEKLRIADECGFHLLVDGYREFSSTNFLDTLRVMTAEDQARGVVVILDTLKKFTDLMDKSRASAFMKVARQFIVKGGTIVGLAHTNKYLGSDGKPVFAGTTDVRDDADCVHILRPLDSSPGDTERVVELENIKRRGNVALKAAYRYCIEPDISYDELLASVEEVDQSELLTLKRTEAERSDADLIAHVQACVREGIDTKMRLADAVAERAGVSKRQAVRILEAYTGADPARHRWQFVVRERGAKVFALLGEAGPATEAPETDQAGGCGDV